MLDIPRQSTLIGPWYQVEHGNYVVTTAAQARALLEHLTQQGGPYGLDTEFVGWKPSDKRPHKYRSEVVCWSLAWTEFENSLHPWHKDHPNAVPLCRRATLLWTPEIAEVFRPWLEDPSVTKVAHDGFSVEYQVFANQGIELNGLINSLTLAKSVDNVPKLGHNAKRHMEDTFGYESRSFRELFIDRDLQTICNNWETDEDWPTLVDYAGLDAKLALELYYYAKPKAKAMGIWDHFLDVWTPQEYVLTTLDSNGWEYDQEVARAAIKEKQADCDAWLTELTPWAGWEEEPKRKYVRGALKRPCEECKRCAKGLDCKKGIEVEPRGWYDLPWVCKQVPVMAGPALVHFLYGYGIEVIAGKVITGKGFRVPELCGNLRAVKRTGRGKKPTDEMALLTIMAYPDTSKRDREMLQKLLNWKKGTNLIGKMERFSQAASEEPDGRLRTTFKCRTDTGRLSASDQPWQQVPKKGPMRKAFVARPGHKLVVADFSGLEMRILAHFLERVYKDTSLKEDILAADVHSATALRIWGESTLAGVPVDVIKGHEKWGKYRDYAKIINYAINYGKGAAGLGVQIKDDNGRPIGTEAAQVLLDDYLAVAYPVIQRWQDDLREWGEQDLGVRTLHGRFRKLPGLGLDKKDYREKWLYRADYRRMLNTPIQGSAADLVIMAMLRCNPEPLPNLLERRYVNWTLNKLGVKMIAQVHDELVFEVPEEHAEAARDEIDYAMSHAQKLLIPTPVDIHIVDCWADAA